MLFTGTRSKSAVESAFAIASGLASDGGLFVPMEFPPITKEEFAAMVDMDYCSRAALVLSKYLTDYSAEEIRYCVEGAYKGSFDNDQPAPLVEIGGKRKMLELWHGPTCAFKDLALQLLPYLLTTALKKGGTGKEAVILVATSGDTGKAALAGFADVKDTRIVVFYPVDGVSDMQKRQMTTQKGNNVSVCAIAGNFDDAQNGVKAIFTDREMKDFLHQHNMEFSSANSINFGRLVPQIVYYVSAYCDMLSRGEIAYGETINVCVPTGNFGNIFAAYIAKMMGLPLGKLVCASNANNVLTEFLRTGTYDRNRKFHLTMSPSMDILISSNLERLLYFIAGTEETVANMKALNTVGCYHVSDTVREKISESFVGYCADENETASTLKKFYETNGYLADTHTSVALACAEKYVAETGDTRKMIVASTASPYKFAADVYRAITDKDASADTGALDDLSALTNTEITYPLRNLAEREIRFSKVIDADAMLEEVYRFM